MVKMLKLATLLDAFDQARLHEILVNGVIKKSRMGFRSYNHVTAPIEPSKSSIEGATNKVMLLVNTQNFKNTSGQPPPPNKKE